MQISSGDAHSLAVDDCGLLYAWGAGDDGQLGIGAFRHRDDPERVELPGNALVRSVSCAGTVSMVLTERGLVLSCGNDEFGQLGHPPNASGADEAAETQELDLEKCCIFTPAEMPRTVEAISHVACGPKHAAAITDDGRVLSWGLKDEGRLGRVKSARSSAASFQRPNFVSGLFDKHVVSLCASPSHTIAFTSTGDLWLWGRVGRALQHEPTRTSGVPALLTCVAVARPRWLQARRMRSRRRCLATRCGPRPSCMDVPRSGTRYASRQSSRQARQTTTWTSTNINMYKNRASERSPEGL